MPFLRGGAFANGPAFGAFALAIRGAEVADFVGVGRQGTGPVGHSLGLGVSTGMTWVGDDREETARTQPFEGCLDGGKCRFSVSDAGLVVPRQPAKIKHHSGQLAMRFRGKMGG